MIMEGFYDEFVKMQCFDSLCLEKNVAMYMIDYTALGTVGRLPARGILSYSTVRNRPAEQTFGVAHTLASSLQVICIVAILFFRLSPRKTENLK